MRTGLLSLIVLGLPLAAAAQIPAAGLPSLGGLSSPAMGAPGLGAAAAGAARPPPIPNPSQGAGGPSSPIALPRGAAPGVGVPAISLSLPPLLAGGLDPAEGSLAVGLREGLEVPTDLRRRMAEALLRQYPDAVEADELGQPAVRGEVLAVNPSSEALARARAAGFRIARRGRLKALGLETATLTAPPGLSLSQALERIRRLDPAGGYESNHLYQVSGAAAGPVSPSPAPAAPPPASSDLRLGLIDGSVADQHAALRGTRISQRLFALGEARRTDHATAVASLLVGRSGAFSGAAPGARLWVADVYGSTPSGGSASAIAAALAWLADNQVRVVNISLVGPQNRLVEAAITAFQARGGLVVAAVGNDGPAAPPLYPAGYPGVVAVTGVDARRRLLPEAGASRHVDFAAPGADMAAAAAAAGGGYLTVRGTSFAAPLVAGALARRLTKRGVRAALDAAAADAIDLGAAGPDPVYGRGLIGFDQRVEPAAVNARPSASRAF